MVKPVMNFRYFHLAVIGLLASWASSSYAAATKLENEALSVGFDPNRASITSIVNKLTGESWALNSVEFAIVSGEETISSDTLKVSRSGRTSRVLIFKMEGSGYKASLKYELGDEWLEKQLSFTCSRPLQLQRIRLGDRTFSPDFREAHFHVDGTVYSVPVNAFLRSAQGGLYAGVEFPFTELKMSSNHLALVYGGWHMTGYPAVGDAPGSAAIGVMVTNMNIVLPAGTEFVAEKEFIGVYKSIGRYCEKSIVGIPRIITTVPAKLDWGEVWAMQRFMAHVLPPLPAPHDGFWLYVNGWWAGLPQTPTTEQDLPAYRNAVDLSKKIGASMLGPATFWLGMTTFFVRDCPYVRTLGTNLEVQLSAPAKEVLTYTEKQGIALAIASEGKSHYREDRPDWKIIEANGRRSGELCWANPAAADWFYEVHSRILDKYPVIRYWGWDGGWLPGHSGSPLDWVCMATNHCHLPGNVAYPAYKNVLSIFQRLRENHPKNGLLVCWAVEGQGPWALRHIDVRENFYENDGADDLRFQTWYQQNFRFIPPSKNMAQIFFTSGKRDYRYCLMSALCAGVDIGFMVHLPNFGTDREMQEYLQFMAKWKQWATDNLGTLRVKRDLFGQPLRAGGIDGSAHIKNGRGFVFLFNPTGQRHIGAIGLEERIFLKPGKDLKVDVIGPGATETLGIYQYGGEVLVDLPPDSCKVLEILPSDGPPVKPVIPTGADVQKAF